MRVRPGPRGLSLRGVRERVPGWPVGTARRSVPTLPVAIALVAVLASACADTTAGQASPVTGAPQTGTQQTGAPQTTAGRTTGPTTGPSSTSVRSTAPRPSTPGSTPGSAGGAGSGSAGPSAEPPAAASGWSVVPPAGLQTWEPVPADDVSRMWYSSTCVFVVSAPVDVPDASDEGFARAHVRYAVNSWVARFDPSITESGVMLSQETDPLRVSDPTRLEPPAVHLQLSGFRYEFPVIGVTDQTYSFVTQGGGQGFVVSAACSDADFAARYDTEIAPLFGDLGIDTGI